MELAQDIFCIIYNKAETNYLTVFSSLNFTCLLEFLLWLSLLLLLLLMWLEFCYTPGYNPEMASIQL